MSVTSVNSQQAYLQSLLQQGASANRAATPLTALFGALTGANGTAPASSGSSLGAMVGPAGGPSPLSASTLSALIALQSGQPNGGAVNAPAAGGATADPAHCSGDAGDSSAASDSTATTTQTSDNPDGSVTTTMTYADGTTVTTTSPPANSGEAAEADPGAQSNGSAGNAAGDLLQQLLQLQGQLLTQAAGTALALAPLAI